MGVRQLGAPRTEIDNLKQMLVDSDYKIIKQSEATFAGSELPYTAEEMQEVHRQRQEWRDRIEELETPI